MEVLSLRDYIFYDFIEEQLGFSLKGSGRVINLTRNANEVIVSVKIYRMSGCINSEFAFSEERCIWSRNYWNNTDITPAWQEFLARQNNYSF